MKKFIIGAFVFLGITGCLHAAEPLPVQFIRSVRQDQPIPYQEELKFFSQLSLHSYVILYELGYVDNLGRWIKPRPKYSPLRRNGTATARREHCSLERLHA